MNLKKREKILNNFKNNKNVIKSEEQKIVRTPYIYAQPKILNYFNSGWGFGLISNILLFVFLFDGMFSDTLFAIDIGLFLFTAIFMFVYKPLILNGHVIAWTKYEYSKFYNSVISVFSTFMFSSFFRVIGYLVLYLLKLVMELFDKQLKLSIINNVSVSLSHTNDYKLFILSSLLISIFIILATFYLVRDLTIKEYSDKLEGQICKTISKMSIKKSFIKEDTNTSELKRVNKDNKSTSVDTLLTKKMITINTDSKGLSYWDRLEIREYEETLDKENEGKKLTEDDKKLIQAMKDLKRDSLILKRMNIPKIENKEKTDTKIEKTEVTKRRENTFNLGLNRRGRG